MLLSLSDGLYINTEDITSVVEADPEDGVYSPDTRKSVNSGEVELVLRLRETQRVILLGQDAALLPHLAG